MHTNWNMTLFLFFSLAGTCTFFYTCAESALSEGSECRRKLYLLSAACSFAAVGAVAFGLNDPANLISLLAKPETGFSTAVLSQIAVFFVSIFFYFRKSVKIMSYPVFSALFLAAVIFCLFRFYAVSTRHALNSPLSYIYLLSVSFTAAVFFLFSKETKGRVLLAITGVTAVNLLIQILFFVRIALMQYPDRILTAERFFGGDLTALFVLCLLLTAALPALMLSITCMRKEAYLIKTCRAAVVLGVFAVCILINQLPPVSNVIEGRMFFN